MTKKVFFNGNIITIDDKMPRAEAVVVSEDRIEFVGSTKEAFSSTSADADSFDLLGATVIPGFNDNHIHATGLGNHARTLNLSGLNELQIVQALLDRFGNEPKGKLIVAESWDYPACPNPHKKMLDDAFPYNPVLLIQFGGHAFWVNSLTLEKMKIGKKRSIFIKKLNLM